MGGIQVDIRSMMVGSFATPVGYFERAARKSFPTQQIKIGSKTRVGRIMGHLEQKGVDCGPLYLTLVKALASYDGVRTYAALVP